MSDFLRVHTGFNLASLLSGVLEREWCQPGADKAWDFPDLAEHWGRVTPGQPNSKTEGGEHITYQGL